MNYFVFALLFPLMTYATDLDTFLQTSLKNHPALTQSRLELEAQEQSLSGVLTLEDPMIGWMKEGEMESWTLSQNLKFPYKYKIAKDIQRSKVLNGKVSLDKTYWEYRSKILLNLFRYNYALQNVKFVEAQRSNLKEALKLMASRRASGGVKQQEELRSYLEQTKLETELLVQNQALDEVRAELESLIGAESFQSIPPQLERPKVSFTLDKDFQRLAGLEVRLALANLEQVQKERSLARFDYLPDFKLSTKQPLRNEGEKTYSLEMTLPLWALGKQHAISSSTESRLYAEEKNVEVKKREQQAQIQSLTSKIENMQKLLVLYETSLLPQAKSNLDSALSSYRVGGVRFLDLVDAQKILYSERMLYLENTLKFIEAVLELESILGKNVSDFPVGAL